MPRPPAFAAAAAPAPPLRAAPSASPPRCVLAPSAHRRRPRPRPRPRPTPAVPRSAPVPVPAPAPPPPPRPASASPSAPPAASPTTSTSTNAAAAAAAAAAHRQSQQSAFLQQQLQLRHKHKLAAKHALAQKAPHRAQKRQRPPSRRHSQPFKDTFQMYMDEISRNDLLAQSEVIHLATQIRHAVAIENAQRHLQSSLARRPSLAELAQHLHLAPDHVQRVLMAGTAAKNTLVSANLRLVTSVARKIAYSNTAASVGIALDDMVQEGSVGLIRAAEKYDASRGYKFSTYATWWIRAYVMRSITTQSRTIKVPATIVDEYARIKKEYNRLRQNGNPKPTEELVARALRITPAKLRFVINVVTRKPLSLDITLDPTGSEITNSRSLGEIVEGDDHIEQRIVDAFQKQELDLALRACLRPLERAVIRLRFGLDDGQPRTLRETGHLLGLSKERIRQLIFRALPKMKTPEIQRMLTDATSR